MRPYDAPAQAAPPPNATFDEVLKSRGAWMVPTGLAYGSTTLDAFAGGLKVLAGGPVINRTGLQGFYAIKLTYAPRGCRQSRAQRHPTIRSMSSPPFRSSLD